MTVVSVANYPVVMATAPPTVDVAALASSLRLSVTAAPGVVTQHETRVAELLSEDRQVDAAVRADRPHLHRFVRRLCRGLGFEERVATEIGHRFGGEADQPDD